MGSVCLKGSSSGRKQLADEPEQPGNAASSKSEAASQVQQPPVKETAREELQQAAPMAIRADDVSGPSKESASAATVVAGRGDDSGPAKGSSETSASLPNLVAERSSAASPGAKPGANASPTSTAEGSRPPVGYDSEGNFSSGAFSSHSGLSKEEPAKRRNSDPADTVPPKTPSLDEQASLKLRKYAKRNRPNRDKFKTQPADSSSSMAAATELTGVQRSRLSGTPEVDEALENQENKRPCLDQKMVKYDIFDDIDADRLKEFDDLFTKVKQNSNYEAHKQKKTKNKAKFSTAAVVDTDEETGQTSIT